MKTPWMDDLEFQTEEITEVRAQGNDGWECSLKGGWSLFVSQEQSGGAVPTTGVCRVYGKGLGFAVRGLLMLDAIATGAPVFYRTAAEEEARFKAEVEASKARKRAEFEKSRAKLDADYEGLPECFKFRLNRFRAHCADFRWEFEPYEMSVCVDAVKIATVLRTGEAIKDWYKLPFSEQKKAVPGLFEGHSGNSFGAAVHLACAYADGLYGYIAVSHGALVPLVGCEAYGCVHEQA